MNPFSRHPFPLANAFRPRRTLMLLILLLAVALTVTACSGAASDGGMTDAALPSVAAESPAPDEKLNVVAGNAVLADLVKQVGGARVEVHTLVPVGSDSHTWQSTPRDSVRINEADLIVSNGAGLSGQVERLIANAANDNAVVLVASAGLEAQELVELPFPDAEHDEDEEHGFDLAGRLLIGDGETGSLSVIDLETGIVHQNAFDLGWRAGSIHATNSGRFGIAVSSDANMVHVIDGGVYLDEHGDHGDLVERDVSRLGLDLSGDRPMHLYVGSEWATVFYDGSGDIVLINEHELEEEGASYEPTVINAGPQHGWAVPLEDDLFAVTIKHPEFPENPLAGRPIGAKIRNLDGEVLYTAEGCPDLLGAAGNGHQAVFGCTGGALIVEARYGEFEHAFVPAPEGSPEDFRLTSVWGHPGMNHFFALGPNVGLYVVDPEAGGMEQLIPASAELRPIQAAIRHDGELLLVVMSDGEVRTFGAHDLDLLASVSDVLIGEIDPSFSARPHIATAPGRIFVTDSGAGQVIALGSGDLEVVDRWAVGGNPTKISFVGILKEGDHPEEGHDHGPEGGDPHFWLNPRMSVHYVNQIANGLVAADPDGAAVYLDNAAAYIEELEELDAHIADAIGSIPAAHRVLITFHDAYGYFGARYDVEVLGFVGSHGGEVSPDDIAGVLELVENRGLPAVFAEPQFSGDALEQVARDTGIQIGIIRSLPDDEYPDYLSMMRANADELARLLK